jgi:hypothetical protein
VTIEAVIPTSVATRDSLELCVLRNIELKSQSTAAATSPPPASDSGALAQGLEVNPIRLKINPNAPNAVMKLAITVGLKKDIPGTPLWSNPASA